MKDTIKAKHEYKVLRAEDKISGQEWRLLYDGEEFVMAGYPLECKYHYLNLEENECYHVLEVFTTRTGKQFIYSRDEEIDADYLVNI